MALMACTGALTISVGEVVSSLLSSVEFLVAADASLGAPDGKMCFLDAALGATGSYDCFAYELLVGASSLDFWELLRMLDLTCIVSLFGWLVL